jgi:hypothetical protein
LAALGALGVGVGVSARLDIPTVPIVTGTIVAPTAAATATPAA